MSYFTFLRNKNHSKSCKRFTEWLIERVAALLCQGVDQLMNIIKIQTERNKKQAKTVALKFNPLF
jgi:hypothetical protein